ncbi:hypothetical protein MRB53_039402 [Persea americana]|nr:hypothetical protein MRB53_039402 [Persea americana]
MRHKPCENPDLTITCNGEEWGLHRFLLCSSSSLLGRKLADKPKVFLILHPRNEVVLMLRQDRKLRIEFTDDQYLEINSMVRYLYTGTYVDPKEFKAIEHVRVLEFASIMAIEGLMDAAARAYSSLAGDPSKDLDLFLGFVHDAYAHTGPRAGFLRHRMLSLGKPWEHYLTEEDYGYGTR